MIISNKSRLSIEHVFSKWPTHSDLGKIYFYDSLYMAAQTYPPPLNIIAATLCQQRKMIAMFLHLLTNKTFLAYFNQSHMLHSQICLCFITFQIWKFSRHIWSDAKSCASNLKIKSSLHKIHWNVFYHIKITISKSSS